MLQEDHSNLISYFRKDVVIQYALIVVKDELEGRLK